MIEVLVGAGVAAVVAAAAHRTWGKAPLRTPTAWEMLAQRHGLAAREAGVEGWVGGVLVQGNDGTRYRYRPLDHDHERFTSLRAELPVELDLDLWVDRGWSGPGLSARSHQEPVPLPMPHVRAFAQEPARAQALLKPVVLELGALAHHGELMLGDRTLIVTTPGAPALPWLEWALPLLPRVVAKLEASRRHVPAATALVPFVRHLERIAGGMGLAVSQTPAALWGTHDGVEVWLQGRPRPHGTPHTLLTARMPTPLGLGLTISPQAAGAASWFASDDVEIGVRAFDDAFYVRTDRAEHLVEILSPRAVELLLHLAHRGALTVRDDYVRLESPTLVDPRDLRPTLDVAVELAALLSARAHPRAGGGAYR